MAHAEEARQVPCGRGAQDGAPPALAQARPWLVDRIVQGGLARGGDRVHSEASLTRTPTRTPTRTLILIVTLTLIPIVTLTVTLTLTLALTLTLTR